MSFKDCTTCSASWSRREGFLADPAIQVVGYQAFLDELELGLFLFNHDACGTTLALQAKLFSDLYDGPIFEDNLFGTEECPEYCLHAHHLNTCPNRCACAYVREILQIVRNWPKQGAPETRQVSAL